MIDLHLTDATDGVTLKAYISYGELKIELITYNSGTTTIARLTPSQLDTIVEMANHLKTRVQREAAKP